VKHTSTRPFAHLALGAGVVALVASAAGAASADVTVRVGGTLQVGANGTYYAPPPRRVRRVYRPVPARRLVVGGSLWAGNLFIGFAEPPPPVAPGCPCDEPPPQVPAYYQPPAPAPQPPVVVAGPAPAPNPRFGVGVFAGGVDVEDREAGDAFGVVGRFNLGQHLALEGELSRDSIANDVRIDHRVGGALVLGLMPTSRLNPYLLAGGGVLLTDVANGQYVSRDPYAEAGLGLELSLTPRVSLTLEGRAGARRRAQGDPGEAVLRSIAPPADEEESFTRGRLGALLYF